MFTIIHNPDSLGDTLPPWLITRSVTAFASSKQIDHECRKGKISGVEPSEELDRLETRDQKFAQFRGYTVKLDTGQTKLYVGMDIESL